jgi:hypothetical protein
LAKCSGITRSGTACKGIPIGDSQWCYAHHPDHRDARRRHGRRGGKRGGRGRRSQPLAEISHIKQRLSDLADDVLAGEVDKGVAAVASQILNAYLRALSTELAVREQLELVERLEALEVALESNRRGYGT